MSLTTFRHGVLYTAMLGLAACSPEDIDLGDISNPENTAPEAHLRSGSNSLTVGQPILLNGQRSVDADGDALIYYWDIIDRPNSSLATIASGSHPLASFTPDVTGDYTVELMVSDGKANSEPQTLTFTVSAVNTPPVAEVSGANSGQINLPVNVSAAKSSDIDGDELTYQWHITLQPEGSSLTTSSTAETFTFTPQIAGGYLVQLIVNDGQADSLPRNFIVNITETLEQPGIEPTDEPLTIWIGEDKGYDGLAQVGASFTAATGIEVVVEHPEDVTGKFIQEAALGRGPDIMIWAHDRFGEWANSGLIQPVSPSDATRQAISDFAWEAVSLDNQVYGYPIALEAVGLLYNKALLPTPPETWEEIKALGEDAIAWDYHNTYFTWGLMSASGGYVFNKVGGRYDVTDTGVNNAGSVAGAELLVELLNSKIMLNGGAVTEAGYGGYSWAENAFSTGEVPLLINGAWSWSSYEEAGIDFGVAPLPKLNGEWGKPFTGVLSAAINANTTQGEDAKLFLEEYLLTIDGLQAVDNDKSLGAVAHIAYQEIVGAADNRVAQTYASALNGQPMPTPVEMGYFWGAMAPALEEITTGGDIQAILDSAAERIAREPDSLPPVTSSCDNSALDVEHQLRFKSYIDGLDTVHIQGNSLWFEHHDWDLPGRNDNRDEPTYVNDSAWWPEWIGDIESRPFNAISPALPQAELSDVAVACLQARGKVEITGYPSAANGYTLSVRLDDNEFGAADWYEIVIGW